MKLLLILSKLSFTLPYIFRSRYYTKFTKNFFGIFLLTSLNKIFTQFHQIINFFFKFSGKLRFGTYVLYEICAVLYPIYQKLFKNLQNSQSLHASTDFFVRLNIVFNNRYKSKLKLGLRQVIQNEIILSNNQSSHADSFVIDTKNYTWKVMMLLIPGTYWYLKIIKRISTFKYHYSWCIITF